MAIGKRIKKILFVVIAFTALVVAFSVVATIATLLPTNVERLAGEFEPFGDRTGRAPLGNRCALNQAREAAGCAPVKVTGVEAREAVFPSGVPHKGIPQLRGTLTVPTVGQGGSRPGVVLMHGSGPSTRNGTTPGDVVQALKAEFHVFEALSNLLVHQGMVVLRYDKRACMKCYPEGEFDPQKFSFSDFVEDAKSAVDFLASQPEVDPDALVIIGHSQGGQLAPFVAHGDQRVAAVVMLAGTTETFEQGLLGQFRRLEEARKEQWDYLGAFGVYLERMIYQQCIEDLTSDYQPDVSCIGGGVTQRALKEYEELNHQTDGRLRDLHCPLLALQGNVDRNINPNQISHIQDIMKGKDAEFHYVKGVNHALTDALEPSNPPVLAPAIEVVLKQFLSTTAR